MIDFCNSILVPSIVCQGPGAEVTSAKNNFGRDAFMRTHFSRKDR